MAALRACRVTLWSAEGVAHTVEVTAETLFEAAALDLAELNREPWANPIPSTATLEVNVTTPVTKHRVEVGAIQRWLAAVRSARGRAFSRCGYAGCLVMLRGRDNPAIRAVLK